MLIDAAAIEMEQRFDYDQIDSFFNEFGLNEPADGDGGYGWNSKRRYVRAWLHGVDSAILEQIAENLNLDAQHITRGFPKNWENIDAAKAFISHTAVEKHNAKRLRDTLKQYNISCFVAHEDIEPTKEWEEEILKALSTMDFFISLHTQGSREDKKVKKGFSESVWCQQEVGFAVARNVKIISIRFTEDPQGFIGRFQALSRGEKKAEVVAEEILELLKTDHRTQGLYKEKIESLISDYNDIPF